MFIEIAKSESYKLEAARILHHTFINKGSLAWPNSASAIAEVEECIQAPHMCIGYLDDGELLGWIGLRPLYKKTWELHPLVVKTDCQQKGIGRKLLYEAERLARIRGIIGIVLGTDDEGEMTSLSQADINGENILEEIRNIRNLKNHPFEFYQKCGYSIVGVIPNASGQRKPDIWMWKDLADI